MHSAGDLVMCWGDFNGHVGWHIVRFDVVHEGASMFIASVSRFCHASPLVHAMLYLRFT